MTSREDNRRLAEAYNEAMGIGADDPQIHDDIADAPDNFTHDYAACQDLSCVRCDAYGDGYSAGKETRRTSRSATGTPNSTRRHAGAIRVWPRGRC